MIVSNTPKSSYVTCLKGSIPNEKGVDDFEQFWGLRNACKRCVKRCVNWMCQNCEETALFSSGLSSIGNNDEGLSRRKLRVRVSSTPHPKASVNSGAFLVVRSDDYAIISPSLIYVLSYISV